MTWMIAADESGNLGSKSQYFVMSAIITKRVKSLSATFKAIPTSREESKFYNSTDDEIRSVLSELSKADITIVSVEVDKYDYQSQYYGKYGNDLYRIVLSELLEMAFKCVGQHDVNVFIDRSTFMSLEDLRSIASDLSEKCGTNLKRCEKSTSGQNKCVQIADYVAGSLYTNLQNDDKKFRDIIAKKISPARKY